MQTQLAIALLSRCYRAASVLLPLLRIAPPAGVFDLGVPISFE